MSQHNSDQQQQQIQAPSSPTNSSSQINSTGTTSDGILLFACTKCNSRHRFEELSRRHQLCKACKSSVRVLNCDYCSGDFKLDEINNNSKICKKCQILQGQHGQPEICACCGLKAAFIGSKCQRCNNSEKKYGLPLNCESCSKKCAFERPDPESRAKVEGKLLCWTCTMNFKRSQAKEKHKQGIDSHRLPRHSHHSLKSSENHGKHTSSSSSVYRHDRHHHHQRTHRSSPVNGQAKETTFNNTHRNQSHHHQNHSSSHNRESINGSSSGTQSNNVNNNINNMSKRLRFDHKTSHQNNGQMTSSSSTTLASANPGLVSSFTDNRFSDPKSTDLTSAMGQLKDEISTLNKRLNLKERELLAKDQQIADLKSTMAREQKEMRDKVNSLQKQHTERITEMQAKLIQMQKQVVTLTKASRANNTPSSTYLEPPMVI